MKLCGFRPQPRADLRESLYHRQRNHPVLGFSSLGKTSNKMGDVPARHGADDPCHWVANFDTSSCHQFHAFQKSGLGL